VGVDLRYVRMLRIFRLFRVFRVSRYLKAFDLIRHVFRQKREELFISLVFVAFILVVTSCIMYFVEHEAQPQAFSSIPATMWWGVATLTTVGYGDMYPIHAAGQVSRFAHCHPGRGAGGPAGGHSGVGVFGRDEQTHPTPAARRCVPHLRAGNLEGRRINA
jgi:hypothetical protein